MPSAANGAGLALRDAARCLAMERGRAPRFSSAIGAWGAGQRQRAQRIARIGWPAATALAQAEDACFRAGLAFGQGGRGASAGWHLPEALLDAALADLPPHPLIDPDWLAARLGGSATELKALPALMRWLSGDGGACVGQPDDAGGSAAPSLGQARIAVCLHLYYPDTLDEFDDAVSQIPQPWDLVVSVPAFAACPALSRLRQRFPRARIAPMPNRGRDVRPFLQLLHDGAFDGYDWVCKLHTKKSPHASTGSAWRQALLRGLLGDRAAVEGLLLRLQSDSALGLWAPAAAWCRPGDRRWLGKNAAWLRRLESMAGLDLLQSPGPYVAGTMFWVRPQALRAHPLIGRVLDRFEPEMGQTDGTLAHALERMFPRLVAAGGYVAGGVDG